MPVAGRFTVAKRYNSAAPCPVCGTGSKGCSVTDDELQSCRGEPSDPSAWKLLKSGDVFNSYRRLEDRRRRDSGHVNGKPASSRPAKDWPAEAAKYAANLTDAARGELARELDLPLAALDAFPLLGWNPDHRVNSAPGDAQAEWFDAHCWTFPQVDARGTVIGITRRFRKKVVIAGGNPTTKAVIAGGKQGLYVAAGWTDKPGPVFIPEGASDVMALTAVGLAAVGRFSNTGGGEMIAELLKDLPASRGIVVLGENDAKANGEWPGKIGAEKTGAILTAKLKRPVAIAYPPEEVKDVREWVHGLAAGQAEAEDWNAIGAAILNHCSAFAPINPPAEADVPANGVGVILQYFRERYRPLFRRGNAIVAHDGETVPQAIACGVPTSVLIERLADATDAPKYANGGIKRDSLPGYFKKWGAVGWGDFLAELPDEDSADLSGDAPAGEEFKRLVREAMLTEVQLGDSKEGILNSERQALVKWCQRFAKTGRWKPIRSKQCWCKCRVKDDGELVQMVGIRHELFSQLKADRRLCEMGPKRFARRAARYGVGASSQEDRPGGSRAIILDEEFIADLLSGLPDDDDEMEDAS